MLQRALTYIVLPLIVLQSVMVMGDAHPLHQSSAEHLVFDENHQHVDRFDDSQYNVHALDSNMSSSQKSDCNHCCHCHGHFSPAILLGSDHILLTKNTSPVPSYSESTFSDTFEVFLRPPIAHT